MQGLLFLAWVAVRVTLVGELPFSPEELHQAMVARMPVEERGAELVISGDGQEVGIAIGERRRVVDVAGKSGASAARIVALAVTDLVEETLPATLPPPVREPPLAVWLALGAGRGIRNTQPWAGTLDAGVSLPYGWLRLAAEVGWTHSLDPSTIDIDISYDSLAFRLGAGGKLGPLEAYIGPWVAPYSVRGTHEKVSVLFGGRVWTRLVVPVSRAVSVSAHVGLDVAANDVEILRGDSQVVFSSPRVGVAGGLGVTVDIDR